MLILFAIDVFLMRGMPLGLGRGRPSRSIALRLARRVRLVHHRLLLLALWLIISPLGLLFPLVESSANKDALRCLATAGQAS
jgi:hypothetical protein